MARRKKIPRKPGFKTKTIYRDSHGRFASRDNSVSEEQWKYRVDQKNRIRDVKIEAQPFREENTEWFRSLKIPSEGKRAGKLSAALRKTLKQIGVDRADTKMEIVMTARTYHGKKVKRKISFHHYNSKKLTDHTIGGIIKGLFYEHGDRPAYPVKIVKGWRKREVTKKETERRRQLHDVSFTIKTTTETRETKTRKRKRKK